MTAALRRLRSLRADTNATSIVVGAALIVAGFVTIGLAWQAVADRLEVPLQMPYLVSGGCTGLGLIAVGVTVVNVQVSRRLNAMRRAQLDELLADARARLDAATTAPKRSRRKADVLGEAASEVAAHG